MALASFTLVQFDYFLFFSEHQGVCGSSRAFCPSTVDRPLLDWVWTSLIQRLLILHTGQEGGPSGEVIILEKSNSRRVRGEKVRCVLNNWFQNGHGPLRSAACWFSEKLPTFYFGGFAACSRAKVSEGVRWKREKTVMDWRGTRGSREGEKTGGRWVF